MILFSHLLKTFIEIEMGIVLREKKKFWNYPRLIHLSRCLECKALNALEYQSEMNYAASLTDSLGNFFKNSPNHSVLPLITCLCGK